MIKNTKEDWYILFYQRYSSNDERKAMQDMFELLDNSEEKLYLKEWLKQENCVGGLYSIY